MRVLHVVKGIGLEAGGIGVSQWQLAEAEAEFNHEVRVLSFTNGATCAPLEDAEKRPRAKVLTEAPNFLDCWFGRCSALHRSLAWADIAHVAGLWREAHHAAFCEAHKQGVPTVLSPRGMLQPWALGHHRWRKRLALSLYLHRDLQHVSCLHALCEGEARDIRALGLRNPIAIVPNGLELAPFARMPGRTELEKLFPLLRERRIVLFLGRIHPKKGLPHTLRAWAGAATRFSEWDLVIAGWDQGGHIRELKSLSRCLGISQRVHFVGPVDGIKKYALLGNSEVFVLSSFSEGFSVAILEAMAARIPVILTPTCNFPEAVQAGAAVSVEPTSESTAIGLRCLLEMSCEGRRQMGERGHLLIEERYTPEKVAINMIGAYDWLLSGGPPPPSISRF